MRCTAHQLACGPDGRCVLCRRQGPAARAADVRPASASHRASWLLVVGALLCGGGALAATTLTRSREASPPASTAEEVIQLGYAGAPGSPPSGSPLPASDATATAAPADSAGDDPRAAWLRRVAAPPARGLSLQEASRTVHVLVYTTGWCPQCKRAKAWMNAHGVAYEERDIEASTEYEREIRRINPRGSIPTFDVEGDVMVGFGEQNLVAMIERAARRRSPP